MGQLRSSSVRPPLLTTVVNSSILGREVEEIVWVVNSEGKVVGKVSRSKAAGRLSRGYHVFA